MLCSSIAKKPAVGAASACSGCAYVQCRFSPTPCSCWRSPNSRQLCASHPQCICGFQWVGRQQRDEAAHSTAESFDYGFVGCHDAAVYVSATCAHARSCAGVRRERNGDVSGGGSAFFACCWLDSRRLNCNMDRLWPSRIASVWCNTCPHACSTGHYCMAKETEPQRTRANLSLAKPRSSSPTPRPPTPPIKAAGRPPS